MASLSRETKHGAGSLDGAWGLEIPTREQNGADETTSPLLSQQSCDSALASTGRVKVPMDGGLSTACHLSTEEPEASGSTLRGARDYQGSQEPLTEHYDNSHHLFEQERRETYRELGANRYPSQTVMTTVIGESNYGKRLPFLELSDKMFRWLLAPLNTYENCSRPTRTASNTGCHGQGCYYLKRLCFLFGYWIILTLTLPLLLCYFVLSLPLKICCGRAVEQKHGTYCGRVFNYEGPNAALTDYIGCPWDEYVVLLERTVNNDKDSYSPVKYFATSDIVIIRDELSWLELRSQISEITATSYGRLLGIIVYGDGHDRRCYHHASECCFIQFDGLMTMFCNKAKISWRDAKRVGTYHILARAFERGCFPRDYVRFREHAMRYEEMNGFGPGASASMDVDKIPGKCMRNTFFDSLTLVKSLGFMVVSQIIFLVSWPFEVQIYYNIFQWSLAISSLFLPGISPLLCVCGRKSRPMLIRSFWGPAKVWLFMDLLFTFQTLQLNIFPFGGAGWQRGCSIVIRYLLFNFIHSVAVDSASRTSPYGPYGAQTELISLAFVTVFVVWVSLYVDRRYLQSFTGTSKVVLWEASSGTSESENLEQRLLGYKSVVSEGSFGSPHRATTAQCVSRPSPRAHSAKGTVSMNAYDNDDSEEDDHRDKGFFEESRDVITSQILAECRQKSIHVWTRIFSTLGGLMAIAIHALAYFVIDDRSVNFLGVEQLLTGTLLGYSVSIFIATVGSTVGAYSLSLRLLIQMIQESSSANDEVFFSSTFHYVLHTLSKVWPLSIGRESLEQKAGYWLSSKWPLRLPSNVYSFLEVWREVVVQCQHDFAENSGVVPATILTIVCFGGYLLYTWIEGVNPVDRGPILLDGLFVVFVFFILLLEASRIENLRNDVSKCLQRWKEEVFWAEQNESGLNPSSQCHELRKAYDALHEVKESIDGCDVGVIAWPGIVLDKRVLYSVFSILITGIAKLGISIVQSLREDNA